MSDAGLISDRASEQLATEQSRPNSLGISGASSNSRASHSAHGGALSGRSSGSRPVIGRGLHFETTRPRQDSDFSDHDGAAPFHTEV